MKILLWLLAATAFAQSPAGSFLGMLKTPVGEMRVGFVVERTGEAWTAQLVSLDQGSVKLKASEVKLEGTKITFSFPQAMASFSGEFSADFSRLEGQFTQGVAIPLAMRRVEAFAPPKRPQTPLPPFPYQSEEVRFPGGAEGVTLAGTLTKPNAPGPHAALILLSGSGQQDRDETLLGHKPFLVLAHALTQAGYLVLRYDDRGTAASTGTFTGATSADFAKDVAGAVNFLRQRAEVDKQRIALLAAPAIKGEPLLRKQLLDLAMAAGLPQERANIQASLAMTQMMNKAMTDPWLTYFLDYDPAPALGKVKCPVLALNGALDMQVNADINLGAIRAALPKAETKKLEGLNHLFQTARTGGSQEYGSIEETFAPQAIEEIKLWLQRVLPAKP
ncbi:MAG: hypothetical protein NW208_12030 [Bryobacter sp.]|nr:hypothetical protein [Bryobacter sp.]